MIASANELVVRLPFSRHLALRAGERGTVELPEDPRLANHIGTVHAGAVFTLGDAASGAALVDALGSRVTEVVPVVRDARIDYVKPARGALTASARVDVEPALRAMDAVGRADVEVAVEVRDASGQVVARLTMTWSLRRPRPT